MTFTLTKQADMRKTIIMLLSGSAFYDKIASPSRQTGTMPHHVFIYIWMNPPLCPEQVLVIVWAGGHYHCYVTRPYLLQLLDRPYKKRHNLFQLCVHRSQAPVLHTASDQK